MSTTLSDTLDGIAYKELKGSNIVHAALNRITATRVFRTAWGDRLAFGRKMVGEIVLASDGSTSVLQPKQHPEMPGLFAIEFTCEPYHDSSKIVAKTSGNEVDDPIEYDFAKVTVKYDASSGTFTGGGNTVTLITEEVNISSQVMTVPGSLFYWAGGTTPVPDANVGLIIGMVEDSVVFHRAATNKRSIVKSLVGKVNNAAFLDAPIGSMLFMGAQSRRSVTSDGVTFFELRYSFKTRLLPNASTQEDSWQKLFRQETGVWTKIVQQGDGTTPPYAYGDFSQLFT